MLLEWIGSDNYSSSYLSVGAYGAKKTFSNITRRCLRCLHEKIAINFHTQQKELLNKRSEIISKCRYENKYIISQFIPNR